MTALTTSHLARTTEYESSSSSTSSSSSSSSSLKRRSSSSPLDCESLQSSLKRVRLSRSPGELRLQRDLGCLQGWEMLSENQNVWRYNGNANAHLTLEDSLRVILHLDTSKIWIQIPRMYPHRPPTIARMEGVTWMKHVVVQDAPSMEKHHTSIDCGTTVIYEWSPVMYLGDLLDFLMQSRTRFSRPSNNNTHLLGASKEEDAKNGQGMLMGDNDTAFFVEEHKMEDVTAAHLFFPPNRFDIGYGKYMDLFQAKTGTPQIFNSSNAMDVN